MSETPWPQFEKGRPVTPDTWQQPPAPKPSRFDRIKDALGFGGADGPGDADEPAAAPGPTPVAGADVPPDAPVVSPDPGAAVVNPDQADAAPTAPDAATQPEASPLVSSEVAPEASPVVQAPPRLCKQCGGAVDADDYCTQCGAKAPSVRDHFEESPASWVGAVCDRGIRHARNEDALATFVEDGDRPRAVLVVCDGVTTSDASDVASLAAARAARDVLSVGRPDAMGTPASRNAAVAGLFARAAAAGNDAVADVTKPGVTNPAACTFVAVLIDDDVVHAGGVGDSRAYWLPDSGEGRQLTRDDSLAEESIAAGVPRKEAEGAADAHTITRWFGIDAQDVVPTMSAMHVPGPGWVLVCSDGLWNYASEPAALAKVLNDAVASLPRPDADSGAPGAPGAGQFPAPVDLARAMVDWANAQGGHDNISACLARVGLRPAAPVAPAPVDGDAVTSKIRPAGAAVPSVGLQNLAGVVPDAVIAPNSPKTALENHAGTGYDPITHQPVPTPGGATAVRPGVAASPGSAPTAASGSAPTASGQQGGSFEPNPTPLAGQTPTAPLEG